MIENKIMLEYVKMLGAYAFFIVIVFVIYTLRYTYTLQIFGAVCFVIIAYYPLARLFEKWNQ